VTGVDSSEDALAEARKTGAVGVTWEWRDMLDLPWAAEFDGAYSFGNSFGYLDRDGCIGFSARFRGRSNRARDSQGTRAWRRNPFCLSAQGSASFKRAIFSR
jgi:hypothetical protein